VELLSATVRRFIQVLLLAVFLFLPGWIVIQTRGKGPLITEEGHSVDPIPYLLGTALPMVIAGRWHVSNELHAWTAGWTFQQAIWIRVGFAAGLVAALSIALPLCFKERAPFAVRAAANIAIAGASAMVSDVFAFLICGGVVDWIALDDGHGFVSPSAFLPVFCKLGVPILLLFHVINSIVSQRTAQ